MEDLELVIKGDKIEAATKGLRVRGPVAATKGVTVVTATTTEADCSHLIAFNNCILIIVNFFISLCFVTKGRKTNY